MKLVICEKPSVAKSIASALGVTSRADGYFEGNGYLISWCIGHLVGLADAAAYDDRYKKWRYEDLPILPDPFRYVVSEEKAAQFHILRSLTERPDVTELVNACDAGREGELIFRLVYEAAGCSKPFSRLWISSMEDAERRGLGTTATRAAIIEKLVSGGFVERKGKNLIPTKAGVNLVTVLPELLTSPKLTADWEQRLNEVAKGQASPENFMDGIEAMAAELVRKYSRISEDGQKLFQPEKEAAGLCPRCGKLVYEGKKNFACSDRACQFVMWKNDRFWTSRRKEMTRKMAADLLKKGRTSVKGMWSEKKGSTYDAVVILDDSGGKYVNFKLEFPKRKDGVHGKK